MEQKMAGTIKDKISNTREKTSEITRNARDKARNAIKTGKEASVKAADKTIEKSKNISTAAKKKTSETMENSPLSLVAGGIAIGAIVAALLPKTEREKKILGNASRKVADGARNAANAAKAAGAAHMAEVGLDNEHLRKQAKDIFQKGYETARSATQAAQDSIKNKDSKK